jgi:hypothetical protein
MQKHTFIFICGLHKSGTSLLHEIMRTHPQISGFRNTGVVMDEGQFLQSVFPPAYVYGGQGRFGFHQEMHMTESHPDANKETASTLFRQWSAYWDLSLPFLVEKSPPNILRTRFLQALFPGSFFIIVLRHPAAVAEATAKTVNISLERLVEHTVHCYELMKDDLPFLKQYYILRYEDLCREPQPVLDELFTLIGADRYRYERRILTDVNDDYFKTWEKRRTYGLFKAIQNLREADHEKRMQFFGYSLSDLEALSARQLPTRRKPEG